MDPIAVKMDIQINKRFDLTKTFFPSISIKGLRCEELSRVLLPLIFSNKSPKSQPKPILSTSTNKNIQCALTTKTFISLAQAFALTLIAFAIYQFTSGRKILNGLWIILNEIRQVADNHMSSVLIIMKTFQIRSLNQSLLILLSPFQSISSRMSSTYSRVGLSTPIYLAIWTRTCSNQPLSRKPLPSISTFLNASSINRFIFFGSLIKSSKFFLLLICLIRSKIKYYVQVS